MAKEDKAPMPAPKEEKGHTFAAAGRDEKAHAPAAAPAPKADLPAVGSKWTDPQGRTWAVEQVSSEGPAPSILMGAVVGEHEPRAAAWYTPETFKGRFKPVA